MATRTFGANLREARTRAGLTQDALAKRLGFKRTTPISIWERSHDLPKPATITRLAAALHCSTAVLLRDVETPYDVLRGTTSPPVLTHEQGVLTADDVRWLELGRALVQAGKALHRSFVTLIEETLRTQPNGANEGSRAGADDGRIRRSRARTPRERSGAKRTRRA